jgi:hypothetical protein
MRRFYITAALLLSICGAVLYFWRVPTDPPGSYLDESSIAYNAHTIAQTGCDEHGARWPLFFRAFGEYKNPTLIYLLALLFKVTGPSITVARICVASLGWLTGSLLGLLAWRMTARFVIAGAVAVMAWLTPWLFESSRVVLEVAVCPSLLALFLSATWNASRKTSWTWRDIVALAATLALLTYSASIGRLLGPLLALGLLLLGSAGGWRDLFGVWLSYGASLIPMLLFQQRHPGALTTRFIDLTYLGGDKSVWASLGEFARRYGEDINPWRWLVTGGTDPRDHLPGTGSMLAVIVLLGLAGLFLVLRHHRRDPWWRFVLYGLVVAFVPAALTRDAFSQLRLIAFPVFFLVLTIPAMSWLLATTRSDHDRLPLRPLIFSAPLLMIAGQGIYFQWLYHRSAPDFWYVFEARFPRKVLAPALATKSKPIYLFDAPGKSGYIQALWHGVVGRVEPQQLIRLQPGEPVPQGGVAISTEEDCSSCQLLARSLNYIVYAVPPYPELVTEPKRALDVFRASIVGGKVPATVNPEQKIGIELLVKNISAAEWPAVGETDGRYAVKLAARWRSKNGSMIGENSFTKNLTHDAEPGDTIGLLLEVTAPSEAGEYWLEVDLMQEGVGWFADHGSEPLRLELRVLAND